MTNLRKIPSLLAFIALTAICFAPILRGLGSVFNNGDPLAGSEADRLLLGYREPIERIRFGWFDKSFQGTFTAAVNDRLPFRNGMVRVNNELDFRLLKTNRMNGGNIVVGKNGTVIEKPYITRAMGYLAPIQETKAVELADKLKKAQQKLASAGVKLVVILTGGKASFRPEIIPGYFSSFHNERPQDYDIIAKAFTEKSVRFINGRDEMKKSTHNEASLFPDGGSHWTELGVFAALEQSLPDLVGKVMLKQIYISQPAEGIDADLLYVANLLKPNFDYGKVNVTFQKSLRSLPRPVILFGTSFVEQMQIVIEKMAIAPSIVKLVYNQNKYARCSTCSNEKLPPDWLDQIFASSLVFLEINEAVSHSDGDYIDNFISALNERSGPQEAGTR
jgi:hypothetical protein